MDDKTAELRDIFVETTGTDEVTEGQAEERGDLAETEAAAAQVVEVVEAMRERYEFSTDLADEDLAELARLVHRGEDDAAVADALAVDEATVVDARLDLHLVRDSDRDVPVDLDALRELLVDDVPPAERADRLDADEETVARASDVVAADLEATRANDRFRDAFAELLTDADLEERHAESAREDGLREATEDIESGVSF